MMELYLAHQHIASNTIYVLNVYYDEYYNIRRILSIDITCFVGQSARALNIEPGKLPSSRAMSLDQWGASNIQYLRRN